MAFDENDFEDRHFYTKIMAFLKQALRIRWIKGYIMGILPEKYTWGTHPYSPEKIALRIKARYTITCRRNGEEVFRFKRTRDLLVWRGQSVLANLLSQGNVGTATSEWKAIASENNTPPNMSDDSGEPETHEFYPVIGTPVSVTYEFSPTIIPIGNAQTPSELIIKGTVISNGEKTLRKIGIIDSNDYPNRNIIIEDFVPIRPVITNEEIDIEYMFPLG